MTGPPDTGQRISYPLAARIASGDQEAIHAFVAQRAGAVRAYCTAVTAPDQLDEALAATFAGFAEAVSRLPGAGDARLDAALLAATRTAAGKHTGVAPTTPGAPCARVPELIAARANGLLAQPLADRLADHVTRCATCTATAGRFRTAEQAFSGPVEPVPEEVVGVLAAEIAERTATTSEWAPAPVREPDHAPEPEATPGPREPDHEPESEPEPAPAEAQTAMLPSIPAAAEPEAEPEPEPEPERVEPAAAEPEPTTTPARPRPDRRRVLTLAGLLVAGGIVALFAAVSGGSDRHPRTTAAHRPSPRAVRAPSPAAQTIPLAATAAHDYDPIGGDGERHKVVGLAVDGKPGTSWTTERYSGNLPKHGVGLYVDAGARAAPRTLVVTTSTPGWNAEVYVARTGPPKTLPAPGWRRVAVRRDVPRRLTVRLPGRGSRYVLVWATSLPPSHRVAISEVTLRKTAPPAR